MKKIFFLLIIQHLSFSIFAQSGTMLPDGFIIPNLTAEPSCTVADKGKMYYNATSNTIRVCNGTDWQTISSRWSTNQAAPNTINNGSGKVGINTSTPQYSLDVNGTARVQGSFFARDVVNIGGTAANGGLTVTDGDIAISSTADAKTWKFDYSDANNHLLLQEDGAARMIFSNGGNIGIGAVTPTAKLSVDGTGSFSGDLTVNNGKGILRNSTATPLKFHVAQASLGVTFTVSTGVCSTSNVSLTSAAFSVAPTAQVGNLVSGTGDFGKLIINIQSTSATQAVVRLCNTTASNITLTNMIFNVLCFGQ